MNAFLKLTWTEMKLFAREPLSMFFTLAFPVLLLLIFGSMYGNEPVAMFGGFGSVDLSVPAYIGMIIGTIGLIGLPVTLANYREFGILRRYSATPIQPETVLWSQVVVSVLMTLIGTLLVFGFGRVLFDLQIPTLSWALVPAIVLCGLSFFALGFLLAGVIPNPRAAQAVGMAIFYPMLFLSGAAMPVEVMPDWLQSISQFLPLTHVVNLLQGLWLEGVWDIVSLVVVVAILLICLPLSRRTFRWE